MPCSTESCRTCAGCRTAAAKSELLRVARGLDGVVRVDPAGHEPGRGAYVHRDPGCAEAALARGGLARVLRAAMGLEEAGRLRELTRENG